MALSNNGYITIFGQSLLPSLTGVWFNIPKKAYLENLLCINLLWELIYTMYGFFSLRIMSDHHNIKSGLILGLLSDSRRSRALALPLRAGSWRNDFPALELSFLILEAGMSWRFSPHLEFWDYMVPYASGRRCVLITKHPGLPSIERGLLGLGNWSVNTGNRQGKLEPVGYPGWGGGHVVWCVWAQPLIYRIINYILII